MTGAALLCPFDPLIWERARTERLFDFHYRIEIYTPQPKRQYGYYVFPLLVGEQLVGRFDLKADRLGVRLLVQASWSEARRGPVPPPRMPRRRVGQDGRLAGPGRDRGDAARRPVADVGVHGPGWRWVACPGDNSAGLGRCRSSVHGDGRPGRAGPRRIGRRRGRGDDPGRMRGRDPVHRARRRRLRHGVRRRTSSRCTAWTSSSRCPDWTAPCRRAARAIKVAFGDVEVPYAVGGPSVAVPGTPRGVAALHCRVRPPAVVRDRHPGKGSRRTPARRSRCSTPNCCPTSRPPWCSATASRSTPGRTATAGAGTLAGGELLHHEGLADTLDDYLNFGPDALTTGRAAGLWSPPSAPTAARCPRSDIAEYQVRELPVERVAFGPGVICVRDNDLDAFGRTAERLNGELSHRDRRRGPAAWSGRCARRRCAPRPPPSSPSTSRETPAPQRIRSGLGRGSGPAGCTAIRCWARANCSAASCCPGSGCRR